MIETLLMVTSLGVLGYAFNISLRMFWTYKSEKNIWKWVYGFLSVFLIIIYFIFAVSVFFLIAFLITSFQVLDILNLVVGVFFLSSSLFVGVVMRHHLSIMRSTVAKTEETDWEIRETSKERLDLQKEIVRLNREIDKTKPLKRLLVSKELKILELSNRLEKLQAGG
jgi:hypothetical protein